MLFPEHNFLLEVEVNNLEKFSRRKKTIIKISLLL